MDNAILLIVILAVFFDVSNGWHDSANAIATVVSTRALSPLKAVFLAACMNIAGAFFSTAVAKTIGEGIVSPESITNNVIIATLVVSVLWNVVMTRLGMPVSCSHALIGGLMGSSVAYGGLGALNFSGIEKVILSLLISPVIGLFCGYLFMKLLLALFGRYSPGSLSRSFGKLQIFSAAFMAFSHGSNDAQKAMGIITLALVSGGFLTSLEVPFWVILVCATAMGLGTIFGGWRVIKTLGHRILKLETIHGFAAETTAAVTIIASSHFGLPVSTTHMITTSIMGVGATKRFSAVRWGLAGKILMAWIVTLPLCFILGWLIITIAV